MIFLGIAIPIGILLGLLLFFSGLYNRNRLAAAASGGLDMFTTNFENQLDSVENYLLNLSLNDATFRSLSEQTDRTRAYLDAYEIAQGFPAVLAANDALMGVVLRSGSGNLYVGRYGETAQQLKQKLNLGRQRLLRLLFDPFCIEIQNALIIIVHQRIVVLRTKSLRKKCFFLPDKFEFF